MKVFISYSTDDITLVRQIADYIRPHADVFYWHKSKVPGQEAWPTIFKWINQADLVLTVITDKTISRAMSVGQEIGRAKAKMKTIIPIVAPDVPITELGFLSGITYQRIDRNNPEPALRAIENLVLEKKQNIEIFQTLLLVGGVFALIFMASKK